MSCPDDAILRLAEGTLSAEENELLLGHIDVCDECRALVADVLRDCVEPSPAAHANEHSITVLPRPGDSVGRYVLLEWIASGGMGMVFSAYDPELDRRVAVKLMAPKTEERAAEELRERLHREALAMARVSHPNVVGVYDVGRVEGSVFVAMEFVDGTTLARREATTSSWQETVALYAQAGRGLAAAHRAGIVHRDFKPENVLVDAQGRARVTDFGLAALNADTDHQESARWAVAPQAVSRERSHQGRVVGTPRFMAPEQARGEATALSDQYSFAVALGRALARHEAQVPASLRAAVARAAAGAGAGRFSDMEVLVRVLDAQLRRAAIARHARALGGVVLALSTLFLVLPTTLRSIGQGDWLSPPRMALTAFLEGAAFVLVFLVRRPLWSSPLTGSMLRITAAVFAVEMVVGFGLSLAPSLRVLIVPTWLLLHAFAAATAAVVVDWTIGVGAAVVVGLFLLSCARPAAQPALLFASGFVLVTALLVALSRLTLRTR